MSAIKSQQMFSINSFQSKKGQSITTMMIGDSENPRVNTHLSPAKCKALLAALRDSKQCVELVRALEYVASL